jgi:sugar/nucleoside kinase (ribokinase family)
MFRPYDFVAIGDTVTDAFIKLKEASVHCNIDKTSCELCMKFGDKIPYQSVDVLPAVGNSANASVSAARLGLYSGLVSDLGADDFGKECLAEFKKNNVSTEFVSVHKGMQTNYHYVLWYEDERTILVKHQEYPYVFPELKTRWLYLSSLASNSYDYHMQIAAYLKRNPDTKLAFQPGTYQMKLGVEKLRDLYKHTEIFFCNVEEAKRILNMPETEKVDIKILLQKVHEQGPRIVCITDGPKGAYAYEDENYWFMPPYPDPKPPYERTGAGDAFSSTVTIALAMGHDLAEALRWGPINSMSVVQYVGAQKGLLTLDEMNDYLSHASSDYKPKRI